MIEILQLICRPPSTNMIWLFLFLAVVVLLAVVLYRYQTAFHDTFTKMNIDHPAPAWFTGNFDRVLKNGFAQSQVFLYKRYKDNKMYGCYDGRIPVLNIKDLDIIKEIMVKHFPNFTDRRQFIRLEPPFRDSLVFLQGDHWKHVRNIISPIFSSSRIKRMTPHVQKNCQRLVEVLRVKQERNEAIELKEIFSRFTLDTIASTGFGLNVNTFENPENPFAVQFKNGSDTIPWFIVLSTFAPWLITIVMRLGITPLSKTAMNYFERAYDSVIEGRKQENAETANDFMDLLIKANRESNESNGRLNRSEIQSQVLFFMFAGFDTVSAALSYSVFLLTNHPNSLQKVQEELEEKLGQDAPNYDNIQSLTYLDMCINETLRMFPAAYNTDRVCTEDIVLHGTHIPKGMVVNFPVYAIQHDPDIWPEPDRFLPERFSTENIGSRHQYAFMPFGFGPRICIGMRLALLELKLCLAYVLKSFTPAPCEKTVYPISLQKLQVRPQEGLWVKL